MEIKECDVLCIGGGGGGVASAVIADSNGADTILVSKESIGYGNSRIVGGVFVYKDLNVEDDSYNFLKDMIVGGDYLNNQDICEVIAKQSGEAVKILERFGGVVGRDKEGKVSSRALVKLGGHTSPRTLLLPSTGPGIGQSLRYAISRSKVKVYEDTMVTRLLLRDRDVVGAICMDLKKFDIFAISAKKTILATGGAGWIYYPHTDVTKGIIGDGYALALSSGAELIDMEQVQFMPFALTHPNSMIGIVVGEPYTAGPKGRLFNKYGDEIIKNPAIKTRAELSNAIILEVEKGNGTEYGGVLLDLKGNKDDPQGKVLYEMFSKGLFKTLTDMVRFAYGDKFANWDEPWDVYPSAHYFMGGIRIDKNGEVKDINNLYGVGEVNGGIHGGNRLGSVSLAELFIFGDLVGSNAANLSKKMKRPILCAEEIKEEKRKILSLIGKKGNYPPVKLIRELQDTMWKYVGPVRDEKGLKAAIDRINNIEERMGEVDISDTDRLNVDLIDFLELSFMTKVAKSVAISALERKESRGAHIRIDHPQRNDNDFLKNVVVYMDGVKMNSYLEPVNLKKVRIE
jgi:succinate dehydrogenase/fumarate reductase flavoprotein subunit